MSDHPFHDASIPPGTVLAGRYTIERLIGSGSSAHVYAAIDGELQVPVAIKVLHGRTDDERQVREATLAMSLTHPSIVRCYGVFSEGTQRYIVMELVEGETLAERLLRSTLAIDETIAVLRSVAEALHHAHAHGVIHRDVTPANIVLLQSAGSVTGARVIDFGIAKTLSLAAATQTVGIGTAAYAAPEQLAGKPTPQSDLYSLGAVLYHMLSGAPPMMGAAAHKVPTSNPAWVVALMHALLSIDSARRPQTADEVLRRIPDPRARTLTVRRRRVILATLSFLICAVITAVAMMALSIDGRNRAGQLLAWLEMQGLVIWRDRRALGAMALAAASYGDSDTLQRIFSGDRLSKEQRQWLLKDTLETAVAEGQLSAADTLFDLGAVLQSDRLGLPMEILSKVFLARSPEMLHLLLRRGMQPAPMFEYTTPFTGAAISNDPKMFDALLRVLSTLDPLPPLNELPLWIAALSRDPHRYIALVAAAGPRIVNAKDRNGSGSLTLLCLNAQFQSLAEVLAVPGLELDQRNSAGSTALTILAKLPRGATQAQRLASLDAAKLLIAHGADINAQDLSGKTALHIAASQQFNELAQVLVDHPEIRLNVQDSLGNTALHHAVQPAADFSPELANLLISRGARTDLRNANTETARDIARVLGRLSLFEGTSDG